MKVRFLPLLPILKSLTIVEYYDIIGDIIKYCIDSKVVIAIQFLIDNLYDVVSFIGNENFVAIKQKYAVRSGDYYVSIKNGDYIVKDNDYFYVVDHELFQSTYMPILDRIN